MSSPMELWVQSEGGAGGSSQPGGFVQAFDSINNGGVQLVDIAPTSFVSAQAGTQAWVRSVRQWFDWDPTDTGTADQITKVAPTFVGVGAGRFNRRSGGHPLWLTQADWTIDSVAGNDESMGNAAAPLKTWSELARRWYYPNVAFLSSPVVVTIASSLPPTDLVNMNIAIGPSGSLLISGIPTIMHSGTLTGATAIDRTTNVLQKIADGALDWSPYLNLEVCMTIGGTPGFAWIAKNLGGGEARCSGFSDGLLSPTSLSPVGNEPYTIRDFPSVTFGDVRVEAASENFAPPYSSCSFEQLKMEFFVIASNSVMKSGSAFGIFVRHCSVMGGTFSGVFGFVSCGCTGPIPIGGTHVFLSCLFTGYIQVTNAVGVLDYDCLFQSTPTQGAGIQLISSDWDLGTVASCDNQELYLGAIDLKAGSYVVQKAQISGLNALYGVNNRYGILARGGTGYFYVTKPVIATTGADARIGGTNKAWAAVPYVEPLNLAQVSVYA